MACGDLSRENLHCSIQNSVVIVAHGGETWLEHSGGKRIGRIKWVLPGKIMWSVQVVVDR